jgi:nicotinate phosphoribosyltransferase
MFHIADPKDVKDGKMTDVYFVRTMEVLKAKTSITNARVIDFAMDIVEMDGRPLAKRGKMSGSKRVLRCSKCFQDRLVPFQKYRNHPIPVSNRCPCGGRFKDLLLPLVRKNRILWDLPTPQAIRRYVLEQLPEVNL